MNRKYTFWTLLNECSIVIPMIQRDYAQGRDTGTIPHLRDTFVEAIHASVTGRETLELDFIYGTTDMSNNFVPLDGQQRLTTLFILHWYAASTAGMIEKASPVLRRFTYQVRDSAAAFCRRLAQFAAQGSGTPGEEIRNQNWFSPQWRHDPTITGMLVMLDALHARLIGVPLWKNLTGDAPGRAPVFYVVELKDFGIPDNIYVQMNSRGKELTSFEHFKARFLRLLRNQPPEYYQTFVHRSHMEWTDVFWTCFRHGGGTGDQEFITYIRFITSLLYCGIYGKHPEENTDFFQVCAEVYMPARESFPGCGNTLDFLFASLDAWTAQNLPEGQSIDDAFNAMFSADAHVPGKLRTPWDVNLFRAVCAEGKQLPMAERLFFFAILLHRMMDCDPSQERLRVLRNLLFHSPNEMRDEPALLAFVHAVMLHGDVQGKVLNTEQREHEAEKLALLVKEPHLRETVYALEDHSLLWGRLLAFDLADALFTTKAATFMNIFPEPCEERCDFTLLRRALLATGDYVLWDHYSGGYCHRGFFGNLEEESWQKILTSSPKNGETAQVLNTFLDKLAGCDAQRASEEMRALIDAFVEKHKRERRFSWRYYFVKYENMLDGESGYYRWIDGNFELRMQEKIRLTGYHRDPFIWTACCLACNDVSLLDELEQLWATGLSFPAVRVGSIRLKCLESGWNFPNLSTSNPVWKTYRINDNRMLPIRQKEDEADGVYDCEDRIAKILPLLNEQFAAMQEG